MLPVDALLNRGSEQTACHHGKTGLSCPVTCLDLLCNLWSQGTCSQFWSSAPAVKHSYVRLEQTLQVAHVTIKLI